MTAFGPKKPLTVPLLERLSATALRAASHTTRRTLQLRMIVLPTASVRRPLRVAAANFVAAVVPLVLSHSLVPALPMPLPISAAPLQIINHAFVPAFIIG